jgi:hypothetical protein
MNFLFKKKCGDDNHKFEARYDTYPFRGDFEAQRMTIDEIVAYFDARSEKTYVHDICVRCGKIVKRQDN